MAKSVRLSSILTGLLLALSLGRAAAWSVSITSPTPKPYAECVGAQISFDCQPNFGPPTFDWDWGDGTAHGNTKQCDHIYFNAGTYTVKLTATCHGTEATDQMTVYVMGGPFTNLNDNLRYYCGATIPAAYKDTCTAAPNQPAGTILAWSGDGCTTVEDGQNTSTATIAGQAGSPAAGGHNQQSVSLQYSFNSPFKCCTAERQHWTVYEPTSLQAMANANPHTEYNTGYQSEFDYAVKDQFGDTMNDIDVNETFGARGVDPPYDTDPAYNWTPQDPKPYHSDNGIFADRLRCYSPQGTLHPRPTPPPIPPNPLGGQKVDHNAQTWYAGSLTGGQGCQVQTDTQQ